MNMWMFFDLHIDEVSILYILTLVVVTWLVSFAIHKRSRRQ